jgi:hypothetical protein
MKHSTIAKRFSASCAGGALLAASGSAHAVTCPTSLPSNAIIVSGANATQSVIKALSVSFQQATPPIDIIFQSTTSCRGISDVTTPATDGETLTVWDTTGASAPCNLGNVTVDVGVSDVFAQTCIDEGALGSYPATGFGDFEGPAQAMSVIVPASSYMQGNTSISAEALFAILGWGGTGMYPVSPWTATSTISLYIRDNTAGVEDLIAKEINLSASKWKGTPETSNTNLVSAVATAGLTTTLGVASTESAQAVSTVSTLAYQAAEQSCGYLPDSTSTSRDKLNVREGRYNLWGPTHFFTAVDSNGAPTNPNVKIFTDAITFVTPLTPAAKTLISVEAGAGVIPQCAMKVSRAAEQSAESSVQPTGDCTGFYEASVPGGSTTHQACTVDGDCADAGAYSHCNYGYCEVQ